jgi:para-nitrobenzyl esterase
MTTVTTTSGTVQGTATVTRHTEVECYLGVPFAASPTGERRFRRPSPVEPWSGVRDARKPGPAVPQNPDPVMAAGGFWQPTWKEEGCLNLNVWTPAADDRGRPVLVWIHGGAYVTGSNASPFFSGAELAAALDVVVVSVNYRLGALGFLALDHLLGPDLADASNAALYDQVAALAWVGENIARFGGDPCAVTLFGQSAGGAAVGTLLGTPATEGLFQRAIMQSGTAERARSLDESRAVTAEVLDAAGIPERDAERLLTMPVEDLLATQKTVVEAHTARAVGLALPFQPSIGTELLPQLPLDAVRVGVNGSVDVLAGTNLNEASFFTMLTPQSPTRPADRDQAVTVITEDLGPDRVASYEAALADELGHVPTDGELLESALSDRLYRQPTNRLLDARADALGRTFSYLFTWASPMMGGVLGSCHALEVPFVFRQLQRLEAATLVGDNPPIELSDWISGAWVEFARRGAPQSPALPDWPEYAAPERSTMVLDRQTEVAHDPRGGLRRLAEQHDRRVPAAVTA